MARKHDLDTFNPRAKSLAYAQAGIAEYLFYDPLEDFVPGRVRAWRLGAAGVVYDPWLPDPATGRWHSALDISFTPEQGGILLRVYDQDGNVIPTNAEMDALLEAERERTAALEAELRRLRGN